MKKVLIAFLSGIFIMSFISFIPDDYDNEKGMALVERDSGLYIFQRCKPVMEYETLGRVELAAIVWNDSPKSSMAKFRKRAKEKFPNADGLILAWDLSECEAIKFK
jgi:hypothetical protein